MQTFRPVIPPSLRKITFYDLFVFGVVFFCVFFAALSSKSMAFNIIISVTQLLKVFIGIYFFKRQNTLRSLWIYFILRLSIDIFIFGPLIFIFEKTTATYKINFFIAEGLVFIS